MSNKSITEREADVKVVSELRQLKDEYFQMKVVNQLDELKETYYQKDIW